MAETLGLTDTLALLIGLYFLSSGLGLLLNPDHGQRMLRSLAVSPVVVNLSGLVVLAIGGTILAIHNSWQTSLASLVTLIGWIAVIKAVLVLIFQDKLIRILVRLQLSNQNFRTFGMVAFLAGMFLVTVALVSIRN